MAEVALSIGGRTYAIHCRDGEEAHITRLAQMIDDKTADARKATPGLTEVRQLLFAALLLADEIHDLRARGNVGQGSLSLASEDVDADGEMITARMNVLAERIEALTEKLAGSDATT